MRDEHCGHVTSSRPIPAHLTAAPYTLGQATPALVTVLTGPVQATSSRNRAFSAWTTVTISNMSCRDTCSHLHHAQHGLRDVLRGVVLVLVASEYADLVLLRVELPGDAADPGQTGVEVKILLVYIV